MAAGLTSLRWAVRLSSATGETACGDRLACLDLPDPGAPIAHWLAVIDGLGHGPAAAQAAEQALAFLREQAGEAGMAGQPLAMLRGLDAALAGTRGAAVGLAWLSRGRLHHVGIGNTRTLRWRHGEVLRLPSRYGVVGDCARLLARPSSALETQVIELEPGDWLLMFTDGLKEDLSLGTPLPEWRGQPDVLAEHLMRHWRLPHDDAGILVCEVGA